MRAAAERNCGLEQLPLEVLQGFCDKIEPDVYSVLSLEGSVNARNHLGGTAPNQVLAQTKRWEKIFAERAAAKASK